MLGSAQKDSVNCSQCLEDITRLRPSNKILPFRQTADNISPWLDKAFSAHHQNSLQKGCKPGTIPEENWLS